MENIDLTFEKFLTGSGSGYGYGSGSGSGYGDGEGSGSGYGDGEGSGSGDGYGYGYGYGDDEGSGSGDGYGYGYGSGYGDGSGSGYGSGSGLKKINGRKIFYVDGLPCQPVEVHNIWAKIKIVNTKNFTLKECFLAKYHEAIAHGMSVKAALRDAQEKYFSSLDFEGLKKKILEEFSEKGSLTVAELFKWHGLLTGSCTFGRRQFQKENDLKDSDKLTLEQFVELTQSAYGGKKIKELING